MPWLQGVQVDTKENILVFRQIYKNDLLQN